MHIFDSDFLWLLKLVASENLSNAFCVFMHVDFQSKSFFDAKLLWFCATYRAFQYLVYDLLMVLEHEVAHEAKRTLGKRDHLRNIFTTKLLCSPADCSISTKCNDVVDRSFKLFCQGFVRLQMFGDTVILLHLRCFWELLVKIRWNYQLQLTVYVLLFVQLAFLVLNVFYKNEEVFKHFIIVWLHEYDTYWKFAHIIHLECRFSLNATKWIYWILALNDVTFNCLFYHLTYIILI